MKINKLAGFATIATQAAVSAAVGSALAGIVAAAALVILLGPTQWERVAAAGGIV